MIIHHIQESLNQKPTPLCHCHDAAAFTDEHLERERARPLLHDILSGHHLSGWNFLKVSRKGPPLCVSSVVTMRLSGRALNSSMLPGSQLSMVARLMLRSPSRMTARPASRRALMRTSNACACHNRFRFTGLAWCMKLALAVAETEVWPPYSAHLLACKSVYYLVWHGAVMRGYEALSYYGRHLR